ncbi:AzlD domain-containing protein [Hoeflea prorocentri]|uniref:AzlD domain-containing protein n=1 Tax=Hoeflea prorocentri TaxID=1922333 RepID=A0A9X3ZGD8_9HYPH|nr:AzlD domain-containing protein [Hoeflea prorocentri]MCY6380667.1 AzlD domain-containing protein [Hoeflea prorocentri]MDA5398467.1 AzlD domain-containing protein [Hoeflea prorocentri]
MSKEETGLYLWPYIYIAIAGWLATDIWRWLGVLAGNKIVDGSPTLVWVRAVATALVAAVVARLILFPTGYLETTPIWLRLSAVAAGFAVFAMTRQKVIAGIVTAEVVLLGGLFLLGPQIN